MPQRDMMPLVGKRKTKEDGQGNDMISRVLGVERAGITHVGGK